MEIMDLKIVENNSTAIFEKIKGKYPNLEGYLVYSSPHGQCNLTTDLLKY